MHRFSLHFLADPPKKRCVLGFAHGGTNLAFGRPSWSHTVPWAKFHGHEDDGPVFFGGVPILLIGGRNP